MKDIWCKSIREEIIGVLWFILAVQCYANELWAFMYVAGVMGVLAHIASVIYVFKDRMEKAVERHAPANQSLEHDSGEETTGETPPVSKR